MTEVNKGGIVVSVKGVRVFVPASQSGLPKDSVILLEQIRTLDKRRLRERMGRVDGAVMERVDDAIAVSFGLPRSRLV